MTTYDDHLRRTEAWTAETIRRHGIAITCVGSGRCSVPGCACKPEPVPWAYTVGFAERDHPEVVTFGLPVGRAMGLLNHVRHLEIAQTPVCGGREIEFGGIGIRFDRVPRSWVLGTENPMGAWFRYYCGERRREPPNVLQAVWPDRWGRQPDEPGCDPKVVAVQPTGFRLLGNWQRPPRRGPARPLAHQTPARHRRGR